MARAALSLAHRLYDNSEALIAAFAAANYPYAAPMLLSLQIAKPLVARALTFLIASPVKSSSH